MYNSHETVDTPRRVLSSHPRSSEFRGFFVLFWIAIAFYIVSTLLLNWRQQGQMLRWALVDVMSHDLLVFAVSDLLMIGFTFTVVPLVWAVTGRHGCQVSQMFVAKGFPSYVLTTMIIRSLDSHIPWTCIEAPTSGHAHSGRRVVDVGLLVLRASPSNSSPSSFHDSLQRDWPWPQSATFCMHCVAMYMKMHSYATTNMEYEVARRRVYKLQKKLADDASRRSSATAVTATAVDDSSTPPSIRRRRSMRKASIESLEVSQMTPATAGVELEDLEKELRKGSTVYPSNQTVGNFFDFLAIPTFVYELEYPRTER